METAGLYERIIGGEPLQADEALDIADSASLEDICDCAELLRRHYFGDEVVFCTIANVRSGACSENCAFCAQSAHHSVDVDVYPMMSAEDLVEPARESERSGAFAFGLVTSGKTLDDAETERMAATARQLRAEAPGVEIHLSVGVLAPQQVRTLVESGVSCLHHNLETSREFFPKICTTHTFDERVQTAMSAHRFGAQLCCGGVFGLGESWADRVSMAMTLRGISPERVPLNFLRPIPGTPLGENAPLKPEECLRIIALYRLMLPDTELQVCGGRDFCLGERQKEIFHAGASGMMSGNYLTTVGRTPEEDRKMVAELGLRVVKDRGCAHMGKE